MLIKVTDVYRDHKGEIQIEEDRGSDIFENDVFTYDDKGEYDLVKIFKDVEKFVKVGYDGFFHRVGEDYVSDWELVDLNAIIKVEKDNMINYYVFLDGYKNTNIGCGYCREWKGLCKGCEEELYCVIPETFKVRWA